MRCGYRRDEDGLEYLNVDGKKSYFGRGGSLGALGAIGQDVRPYLEPGRISWEDAMVPGGYISGERVKVMDAERIDVTMVYPSLGLMWEYDCDDLKVAAANCRAYNNWVFDFCGGAPERLVPVAHIPMGDVDEAIKEMQRTAGLGAKAMMVGSDFHEGRTYGHSYYDPFWAEAQAIDMPITIHPSTGKGSLTSVAYPNREEPDGLVGEHPRGREREDELHQPLQSWYVRQVSRPEGGDPGGGYRVAGVVAGQARREVRGQRVYYADARNPEHLLQEAGVHIDGPG